MLFLYYTNADKFKDPQDRPDRSVGGFISSSLIGNDQLSNVFSDLDQLTLDTGSASTKGIAIQNQADKAVTGLMAWIEAEEEALAELEIAFVKISQDECGDFFMEKLPNATAAPYYATFYKPTVDSKLSVGVDIAPNEYLGMWVKRNILESSQQGKDCQQVYDDHVAEKQPDTEERFVINFEWQYAS